MFILAVSINTAANQEFCNICSVVLARQVQRRCKLRIDKVWLGASSLQEYHHDFAVAKCSRPVNHSLAILVVHVVLRHFIYI